MVYDHHADVYGLAVHPDRPFTVVSSSRDTTLRVWTMDETIVGTIKTASVLASGELIPDLMGSIEQTMKAGAGVALCGPVSKSLCAALSANKGEVWNPVVEVSMCFYFTFGDL